MHAFEVLVLGSLVVLKDRPATRKALNIPLASKECDATSFV